MQPTRLLDRGLVQEIRARFRAPDLRSHVNKLLVQLCQIDTTPKADPRKMRAAEDACFRILEGNLSKFAFPGARLERRPINPVIQKHPNFSLLHFTKTTRRPEGLSPERTYAGRGNLLYVVPGTTYRSEGSSIALNAHLDVVAPYFGPEIQGNVVYGRGACDDKGPVVSIVTAFRVLSQILAARAQTLNSNVVAMFVVEEETGGNGSLSLALDRELKQLYETVLVAECTGLKIYPANRGAVWYRAELTPPKGGGSVLEMAAFVIEEMEKEGVALRSESRHPLFPQRPVQTCHGILGGFGEHPSRICGHVAFKLQFGAQMSEELENLVKDSLDAGLSGYIGLYGDKSKVIDSSTGKPMVKRHFQLQRIGNSLHVDVYGAPGHMGSVRERDGAITKAAHLIRSLVFSRQRLEKLGGKMHLTLASGKSSGRTKGSLVLEGGQGFVPTHTIDEVMSRLRQAAQRGAEHYLQRLGRHQSGNNLVNVTYEKLHNVAFDGDPDSEPMRHAIAAAKACGIWKNEPVLGWTVSCDARLFATEYPQMPVLTFGPGHLMFAHSDQEQISIDEILAAAEFLTVFLLLQTGTL